jgi:predicted transcriptional regulator
MECRLAMLVHSFDELKEKLKAYLDSNENKFIEDLYRGEVKNNKEALMVFDADDDMANVIENWIKKHKFSKLLELWVKGLHFDWLSLYRDYALEKIPRRISVPTYPFAEELYGIKVQSEISSLSDLNIHHSLQENTSTISEGNNGATENNLEPLEEIILSEDISEIPLTSSDDLLLDITEIPLIAEEESTTVKRPNIKLSKYLLNENLSKEVNELQLATIKLKKTKNRVKTKDKNDFIKS